MSISPVLPSGESKFLELYCQGNLPTQITNISRTRVAYSISSPTENIVRFLTEMKQEFVGLSFDVPEGMDDISLKLLTELTDGPGKKTLPRYLKALR